jgi:integrase
MALTDTFARQVKYSGQGAGDKHTDGQGMFLLVKPVGKYWRMAYRFDGKQKTLALGVYPEVTLAAARRRRDEAREHLAHGVDPGEVKREKRREDDGAVTFQAIALEWLDKTNAGRAPKTIQKITGWLHNDLFPSIGAMPVPSIKAGDVLDAVQKVEERGAIQSAHRIKSLCSQVLRYAAAKGIVEHDVTANLRGALVVIVEGHYAAITEPKEVGALLRAIYDYQGHHSVVGALKLAPLVFTRPGELRGAEWEEFDLEAAEWRIPARRMKMRVDHIVPLAGQAVDILRALHPLTGHGKYVFPSLRTDKQCISDNAVNAALRGLGYSSDVMTGHGFRATARTIMDEVLDERVDLIEHQMAHVVKDVNGRAYNRTAHLPARRAMMQRWADYLETLRLGPR